MNKIVFGLNMSISELELWLHTEYIIIWAGLNCPGWSLVDCSVCMEVATEKPPFDIKRIIIKM